MPQATSWFQSVGDNVSWETTVPERKKKQQWMAVCPEKLHGTDWIGMCTYKWTPRNAQGVWGGSFSEAGVLHDLMGTRQIITYPQAVYVCVCVCVFLILETQWGLQ